MWSKASLSRPRASCAHGLTLRSDLWFDALKPCQQRFLSSSNNGGRKGNGRRPPEDGSSSRRGNQKFRGMARREGPGNLRGGSRNQRDNLNPKQQRGDNFDRRILQPSARGELAKKHSSGIPRLAARKPKARLHPGEGRKSKSNLGYRPRALFSPEEGGEDVGWEEADNSGQHKLFEALSPDRLQGDGDEFALTDKNDNALNLEDYDIEEDSLDGSDIGLLMDHPELIESLLGSGKDSIDKNMFSDHDVDSYYAPELANDDVYYWREEDYEVRSFEDTYYLEEDEYEIMPDGSDEVGQQHHERPNRKGRPPNNDELKDENDLDQIAYMDINEFPDKVAEESILDRMVLPLRNHGSDVDAFNNAMLDHPSDYARVSKINPHVESNREPKPIFPQNRASPPIGFVKSFSRFLYITGLPPFELNGETFDMGSSVHRDLLQKDIARVAGVDSTQVYPANSTSGFVGYNSPKELSRALSAGPTEKFMIRPASITKFEPSEDDGDFGKISPEATVRVSEIPSGNTSVSLARDLFPKGTEAGEVYGLSPEDIHFETANSVLIRFSSAEQAESALGSSFVKERLQEIGTYPVRVFRARRELVHAGFGGPSKSIEKRIMGPRLIVDGDMPSKNFYISHAGAIYLRNLDPTLTKEQLSARFQPYCAQRRDVDGSIEFPLCSSGETTGCAYIGFDLPGEAEEAIRACAGQFRLGDRMPFMKLVKDRRIPGQVHVKPEKRPERPVEELLDDLHNWQKYADPDDLDAVLKAGISMHVLDDALRSIRYSNPTFGPLDASLRSESIKPNEETGGLYKNFVRMYVATLKDCLATPEDVGEMYEAMHFPGEPIDLSIFDREKERLKKLDKKRFGR